MIATESDFFSKLPNKSTKSTLRQRYSASSLRKASKSTCNGEPMVLETKRFLLIQSYQQQSRKDQKRCVYIYIRYIIFILYLNETWIPQQSNHPGKSLYHRHDSVTPPREGHPPGETEKPPTKIIPNQFQPIAHLATRINI